LNEHNVSQQAWWHSEDLGEILQRLKIIWAVDGAPHSQKNYVEAKIGRSTAKVLTERSVLMMSDF